jgi:hypothetical protein
MGTFFSNKYNILQIVHCSLVHGLYLLNRLRDIPLCEGGNELQLNDSNKQKFVDLWARQRLIEDYLPQITAIVKVLIYSPSSILADTVPYIDNLLLVDTGLPLFLLQINAKINNS